MDRTRIPREDARLPAQVRAGALEAIRQNFQGEPAAVRAARAVSNDPDPSVRRLSREILEMDRPVEPVEMIDYSDDGTSK